MDTLQTYISQSVEYQIGNQLSKIAKQGERVFLSGTTVFWLNAYFNLSQVRGGRDEASVDKDWRQAAWEIREGESLDESLTWLKRLKINYLVIHTSSSREYYHDFSHVDKFEDSAELKMIYGQDGDRIYQVLR